MSQWEAELAALVEHRGAALVGYATMLCGDRRDAEDLVQDAVVKVFSRLRGPAGRQPSARGEDDGPGVVTLHGATRLTNLEGYVRSAVLTGYLDTYRRRRRWAGIRHLAARPEEHHGHEAAADDRADVTAALAALTPMQRACVVLRFYSDLTVPQVAAELGCAEGTVKRHLHDANGVLRGRLAPASPEPAPTAPPPREVRTPTQATATSASAPAATTPAARTTRTEGTQR